MEVCRFRRNVVTLHVFFIPSLITVAFFFFLDLIVCVEIADHRVISVDVHCITFDVWISGIYRSYLDL